MCAKVHSRSIPSDEVVTQHSNLRARSRRHLVRHYRRRLNTLPGVCQPNYSLPRLRNTLVQYRSTETFERSRAEHNKGNVEEGKHTASPTACPSIFLLGTCDEHYVNIEGTQSISSCSLFLLHTLIKTVYPLSSGDERRCDNRGIHGHTLVQRILGR